MDRFPLIPELHLRWMGGEKVGEAAALSLLQAVDPSGSPLSPAGEGDTAGAWLRSCGLAGELTLCISDAPAAPQAIQRALTEALACTSARCRIRGLDSEELVMDLLDAGFSAVVLDMRDDPPHSAPERLRHPDVWSLLSAHLGPAPPAASTSSPSPPPSAAAAAVAAPPPFFIPRDRLVLSVPWSSSALVEATLQHFAPAVGEFILALPTQATAESRTEEDEERQERLISLLQPLHTWLQAASHPPVRLNVSFSSAPPRPLSAECVRLLSSHSLYSTTAVTSSSVSPPAGLSTFNPLPLSPSTSSSLTAAAVGGWLGSVLVAHARSDRADGLWSTVVVDEGGVALGLVYSSEASVLAACREQRGVYWSRSRQALWRKGETSGACQRLLQVALDCDGDALRFTVEQEGAGFCHLNRWTCWPSAASGVGGGGGQAGLSALHRTLWERRRHPLPGSYTNRLLADEGLLNSKVLEEARELVEAGSAREVASEAADLLYFTSVLLCKSGVTWAQVERCLDLRSLRLRRRAGNAKPPPPPTAAGASNGALHSLQTAGSPQPFSPVGIRVNLSPSTHVAVDGKHVLR